MERAGRQEQVCAPHAQRYAVVSVARQPGTAAERPIRRYTRVLYEYGQLSELSAKEEWQNISATPAKC